MFEPHFGIDESGKGDFFGPLVIAGAYTDKTLARSLIDIGVNDSKKFQTLKLKNFPKIIKETPGIEYEIISISPKNTMSSIAKLGILIIYWLGVMLNASRICAKKTRVP